MKKYGKTVAAVSGIYALLLFVVITLDYVITDGSGWDMFGVIIIAGFSVPVFVAILGTVFYIDAARNKRADDLTHNAKSEKNAKFEKILGIISLCLSVTSVIAVFMIFFLNSDSVYVWIMIFSCIANIAILVDRPVTKLILKIARKKHPGVDIDSRGVTVARVCCMVAGLVVWPAVIAAIYLIVILLNDIFKLW